MRAEEHFLRSTLPWVALSLEGEILLPNDAFSALSETAPAQLTGTFLAELVTPAHRAELEGALLAARAGLTAGDLCQSWELSSRVLHVRLSWTLVARDGVPSHLSVIAVDETERVEAQADLERAQARWHSLLVHSAAVTWTADDACNLLSVTGNIEAVLGYHGEDILGLDALSLVHPQDLPRCRELWEQVVSRSSSSAETECRVLHADGSWRWVHERITDLRDDPAVQAISGNTLDIHQRKEAETARLDAEKQLRDRFEQLRVPQSFAGPDGVLTEVNEAWCELLGYAPEEAVGMHISELSYPTDAGLVTRDLRELLAGTVRDNSYEHILRHRDGHPVPTRVYATGIQDGEGRVQGSAAIVLDLSQLRDVEARRRQQEEFFLALSQSATELSIVADATGHLLYVSPAITSMLGYEPGEILMMDGFEFVHPDDLPRVQEAFACVVAEGTTETLEIRLRTTTGEWLWAEETMTNLLDTPVGGVVANLRDITERIESDRALRKSEERYRTIADTAREGIWAASPRGETLYANARMAEILGRTLQEIYELPFSAFLPPEALATMRERLASRGARGPETYDLPYLHPDGTPRTLMIAASPLPGPDGTMEGSLAMVSDVTEARQHEEELRHAALHDSLTSLPNRALLLDRLHHALEREAAAAHPAGVTAVLFVDLDQFKLVNDTRGHGAGDELLVEVAARLRAAARPADTVARFGGDEFLLVCEEISEDDAVLLGEAILASFEPPFDLGDRQVHISASIGIACSPADSAADLLRFADTAMYAAKSAGRRRVRLFDHSLALEVSERYELSSDLRLALATSSPELTMHYQPIIDVPSGEVLGAEALARWDHPVLGPVSPARFVPVAEDTGLAPELDRWAFRHALADAARMRSSGVMPESCYVAVNLSARNLSDPTLEEFVLGVLDEVHVDPSSVVLEVTESAMMGDTTASIELLTRLCRRGFRIALDDFGTGHSSLAHLRDLPITMLKIDRSFICDITRSREALAIVASILDLARAIDVRVIAEGIELPEQAALLQSLGCTVGQGWLWARAEPVEVLQGADTLVKRHPLAIPVLAPEPVAGEVAVGPEHGLPRLLQLHLEGASFSTIASALNREGFKAPGDVRWHRMSVARVVADAAYPDATPTLPTPLS